MEKMQIADRGASAEQGEEEERDTTPRGSSEVNRAYTIAPRVSKGFFPLDRLALGRRGWSPQMLEMALRQAVELGSYARAADNFSELTNVPDFSEQYGAAGAGVRNGGRESRRKRS